jgi:diadenylate cyclase
MQEILDYLTSLTNQQAYPLGRILVEMALIGVVVYGVLRFLHGTRGARLLQSLVGLLVVSLLVVRVVAERFQLERIEMLIQPFVWTVLLTTLVVFQPELRRGLMRLGEARWRRQRRSDIDRICRPVAAACAQLSKNKIGALIAIERDIGLSGLTDQGVKLDARLTPELLNTIFWPGSALHDLGVIIQRGRIVAAGCPFPLGDAEGLDRSIGSRHRAAIGLSLDSDALIVVVSEETGIISVAEGGRLQRHIPPEDLFDVLVSYLSHAPSHRARRGISSTLPPDVGDEDIDNGDSGDEEDGDKPPAAAAPDDAAEATEREGGFSNEGVSDDQDDSDSSDQPHEDSATGQRVVPGSSTGASV